MRYCFVAIFLLCCAVLQAQSAGSRGIETIALTSLKGKKIAWAARNKTLTAFVFLSPDCPLSQNYSLVLNKLQQTRATVLDIVGVFAGDGYTNKEMNTYQRKYAIGFDLVRDPKMELASLVKARVTPEVFLYDSNHVLVYRGAIDDWVISIGKKKKEASVHYLQDAIEQYLHHQAIVNTETTAVGCYISYK